MKVLAPETVSEPALWRAVVSNVVILPSNVLLTLYNCASVATEVAVLVGSEVLLGTIKEPEVLSICNVPVIVPPDNLR